MGLYAAAVFRSFSFFRLSGGRYTSLGRWECSERGFILHPSILIIDRKIAVCYNLAVSKII